MSIRSTRRRRTLSRTGVGFVVVILLSIGFEVGIHHVPPDAVQVTVSSVESGRILASRTITDARIVADYYSRVSSLPVSFEAEFGTYNCNLYDVHTLKTYTFRFTRLGLPVKVATVVNICGNPYLWLISSGGLPGALSPHIDPNGRAQPLLNQAQS